MTKSEILKREIRWLHTIFLVGVIINVAGIVRLLINYSTAHPILTLLDLLACVLIYLVVAYIHSHAIERTAKLESL